jgi:hypothetical protein
MLSETQIIVSNHCIANHELERMRMAELVANILVRYYSTTYLEGLKNTMKPSVTIVGVPV